MHPNTEAAVRTLRQRIIKEVEILSGLESRFKDEYFKRKCKFAIQDVEAAETMFLRPLETEDWRTPVDEARTLDCAEAVFQLGVLARTQLQEIMQKWGPSVIVVHSS
jgi:hypothetical protein